MQSNPVALYVNAVEAVHEAQHNLDIALHQFHHVLPEPENLRVFTVPSPGWWFLLHAPTKLTWAMLDLVIPDGVPGDCRMEETFLLQADPAFNWGIVREDAVQLIRELGWRNKADLWPDLHELKRAAGKIVGKVTISIESGVSFYNAEIFRTPMRFGGKVPAIKGGYAN